MGEGRKTEGGRALKALERAEAREIAGGDADAGGVVPGDRTHARCGIGVSGEVSERADGRKDGMPSKRRNAGSDYREAVDGE
jgi:hypothetical protein